MAHSLVIPDRAATQSLLLRVLRTLTKKAAGKCRLPNRRFPSKICATLDLSRGLRMDDRKPPTHPTTLCSSIDADAALADSVRESSSAVYFASADEISEGFTIALRAMGFEEVLLPDIIQSGTASNPEDS